MQSGQRQFRSGDGRDVPVSTAEVIPDVVPRAAGDRQRVPHDRPGRWTVRGLLVGGSSSPISSRFSLVGGPRTRCRQWTVGDGATPSTQQTR